MCVAHSNPPPPHTHTYVICLIYIEVGGGDQMHPDFISKTSLEHNYPDCSIMYFLSVEHSELDGK